MTKFVLRPFCRLPLGPVNVEVVFVFGYTERIVFVFGYTKTNVFLFSFTETVVFVFGYILKRYICIWLC